MRSRNFVAHTTILLALTAAACAGGGSTADRTSADTNGPQNNAELDALFRAPPDPLQLEVTPDKAQTVSAVMSYEGGTLSATGADGTTYTLEIPEGALHAPTRIWMTPLSSVDGLPFGEGITYSVQLEPDGLRLSDVAILTIASPQEIPVEEQVFFAFQGDGKEFSFAAPTLDSRATQIVISHFSGYGVDKGLLADTEPVRKRIAGDAEQRLASILARELQMHRQKALLGTATGEDDADFQRFWAWYVETYYNEVIRPRLAAAGESCAAGRLALETLLTFERMLALMGGSGGWSRPTEVSEVADKVAGVCLQEEYELCRDAHIIHRMIPVVLGMLRQSQLLGMANPDALEAQGWALVGKCLTFELEFESTASTVTPGVDTTSVSSVEAKVPLTFNKSGGMFGTVEGKSALINHAFSIESPNCRLSASRGGSTLHVQDLSWSVDFRDKDDEVGYVSDILLTFVPDPTTESWTGSCTIGGVTFPFNADSANVWSSTYGAVHLEACMAAAGGRNGQSPNPPDGTGSMDMLGQIDPESGLSPEQIQQLVSAFSSDGDSSGQTSGTLFGCGVERDWDVKAGDIFATREWSLTSTMGADMKEEGSFLLRHTPQ